MLTLIYIVLATITVSLLGLIGIISFFFKAEISPKILRAMIAFSSGALLGEAFIHLIPEGLEQMPVKQFSVIIMVTLVAYFVFEKFLHLHHHHDHNHPDKSVGFLTLFGDALHNFIDGLVIAGAFILNPVTGISTTVAIISHEIPHELGDFAVLLHFGFSRKSAIFANFLVALVAVAGGITGFFAARLISQSNMYIIPVAIGGFLYISVSDLFPVLRTKQNQRLEWLTSVVCIIAGIMLMSFIGG